MPGGGVPGDGVPGGGGGGVGGAEGGATNAECGPNRVTSYVHAVGSATLAVTVVAPTCSTMRSVAACRLSTVAQPLSYVPAVYVCDVWLLVVRLPRLTVDVPLKACVSQRLLFHPCVGVPMPL